MTDIANILTPGCTIAQLPGVSRKRVLQQVSDLLAAQYPQLSARALFDALNERERMGTTAVGEGVAIPHCRTDVDKIVAAFFVLNQGIDYDAPDGEPVDILFTLVVPTGEDPAHLDVLAILAKTFADSANRAALRDCTDDSVLHQQMLGLLQQNAA